MATQLSPETVERIADLAKRLGYGGPKAQEQVLKIALDDLDAKSPPANTKDDPRREEEGTGKAGGAWRRREAMEREYNEDYPPSGQRGASGRIQRGLSSVSGMAGRIVRRVRVA